MRLPHLFTRSLVFASALAGCGSAHMIKRTDTGGVLMLDGFRSAAANQANELMTARCGGPYTIVAEGDEFVAGKTEYRVHFVCGATPDRPQSEYAPSDTPESRIPDANRIGLE